MEDKKEIVTCKKCQTKIRIPSKDKLIRFDCKKCGESYCALLGSIVPCSEESKPEPEKPPSGEIREASKIRNLIGNVNFWRILTVAFILLSISLFSSLSQQKRERNIHDQITNEAISSLKASQKRDFEKLKGMLTEDSKNIFETFIESQFAYNDPVSENKINKFIESIQPLEYQTHRQFKYTDSDNNTNYFRIDYVPNGDSYLIRLYIEDFTK